MVNVQSILKKYYLKTKANDLDVDKLKTVPIGLKNLSDLVDKNVKVTIFNKVNTKLNKLDKKVLDATTLLHINQYNTDKQKK